MSNTTLARKVPAVFSSDGRKERKDYFTVFQTIALILLTLVISTGGWYLVGKYYFWTNQDVKQINKQLEFLQQQVQAKPNDLKMRVALGYTYFLKDNNEKAINEFNKVLATDKKYNDAYYNLGLVYLDEERLDDALEMFGKSVELAPQDYKGYLQKGVVYRKLKMYKEAVASLEKANKMMPGSANIIYEIGCVAEDKGEKNTEITIFKEALSYDPLYKDALEGLKRVNNK